MGPISVAVKETKMPAIESAPSPQRVAVIGAGMVGLATAWFLQERGIQVTVFDRKGVAAGASWGNAGWLTPGITTPRSRRCSATACAPS